MKFVKYLLLLFFILCFASAGRAQSVGCGATNWVSSATPPAQYDQSTCGNVTTDGSVLSYEPGYVDGSATNLNTLGCGATYTTQGPVSFKLTADLNCGASSNAFNIRPSAGGGHVGYFVNLAGHTITGTVIIDDNNGGVPDGAHVFGGSWTCAARPCLFIAWTNGFTVLTNPMVVHHITWNNTSDTGSMTAIGGDASGPASIPYTIVQHHNDVTLSGGTVGDPNRTTGLTENGKLQKAAYYNNKIQNSSGTNHGSSEGMICYDAIACDIHNNFASLNQMTLSNGTPGRMALLDGDSFGNGVGTAVTANGNIYNNYFNSNGTRAVRIRSASNATVHDNLIDNCTDDPVAVSYQSCGTDWGDPTAAQGGSATYDYGTSVVYHNVYNMSPKVNAGGRVHWGDNAIGITFKEERIACISTGCSGNTQGNPYQLAHITNHGGTQFFNITMCRLTTDFAFAVNGTIDGTGQTQTSTSNNFSVGTITASNGAVNNALASCPLIATDIYYAQASAGANDGSSCANAFAYNDVTNGINVAGSWAPGNKLHICGTITSALSTNIVTAQASGTNGSPITIKFETGASLQSPGFPGNPQGSCTSNCGAIDTNNFQYITIDGGTNGFIQNTANGSSLANQIPSVGIDLRGDNLMVKNLTIKNIYLNTSNEASFTCTGGNTCPGFFNTNLWINGGTNVEVCNNTLSNSHVAIQSSSSSASNIAQPSPANCSAAQASSGVNYYNNFTNDHGWQMNIGGSGYMNIFNNEMTDWAAWFFPTGSARAYHLDGIIVFGGVVGSIPKPNIYNNYIHGDFTGFPTGFIFCTYGVTGSGSACTIYNNLLVGTGNTATAGYGIYFHAADGNPLGPHVIYNNTLSGFGNGLIYLEGDSIQHYTVKNNILISGNGYYAQLDGTPTANYVSDHNIYTGARTICNFPCGFDGGTTLAQWQARGEDAGGKEANPNLNGSFHIPNTSSPAYQLGANLTSVGITPLDTGQASVVGINALTDGLCRVTVGSWDAGAYPLNSCIAVPSVPAGLTAVNSGTTNNLNWTASTGSPSGYFVFRSLVPGGPYTQIASVASNSYADAGLVPNTYYYVVEAWNAGGASANSAEANATVLPGPVPPVNSIVISANPLPAQPVITSVSPANTYVAKQGCSQDGHGWANPCIFHVLCTSCSASTVLSLDGAVVAQSYAVGIMTATVPLSALPIPSVVTAHNFSAVNPVPTLN